VLRVAPAGRFRFNFSLHVDAAAAAAAASAAAAAAPRWVLSDEFTCAAPTRVRACVRACITMYERVCVYDNVLACMTMYANGQCPRHGVGHSRAPLLLLSYKDKHCRQMTDMLSMVFLIAIFVAGHYTLPCDGPPHTHTQNTHTHARTPTHIYAAAACLRAPRRHRRVSPGPPAQLREAAPPGGCLAAQACLAQPAVLVLDAGGNPAAAGAASAAVFTVTAAPALTNASVAPPAAAVAAATAGFTAAVAAGGDGAAQFSGIKLAQPG
jgi:hypothetical protein